VSAIRIVLKRGNTKSLFRSECVEPLRTNRSETQSGTRPCLTLFISAVISRSCLLYKEGVSARLKSSSYLSEWDLYIALEARSCIRSSKNAGLDGSKLNKAV